jgi:integrating conjugative element protein (TIGR03765 family)
MGKIILAVGLSVVSSFALSASKLIEIDRVGHTASVQLFYTENALDEEEKKELPPRLSAEDFYTNMLPIHTINMSPGLVRSERRDLPRMMRPVFVIGADKQSIQWLKDNKDALIESKAIGMLVEVETIEQFREVGKLAQGLQISPTTGDQLAQILGISNYPILITKHGFEQ